MTFEVDERIDAAGEVIRPLDDAAGRGHRRVSCARRASKRSRSAFCTPTPIRRMSGSPGRCCARSTPRCSSRCRTKSCANFVNTSGPRRRCSTPMSGRACAIISAPWRPTCAREDFDGKVHIMRSNGGVMSIRKAQEEPVSMMESGPVAGMIGAGRLAARSRYRPRHRLRHGRHHRQGEPDHRRHARDRGGLCDRRRRRAASRCSCRWSTSSRSAPAAARSPGSTRPADFMSVRRAPAPIRGPPATARGRRTPW